MLNTLIGVLIWTSLGIGLDLMDISIYIKDLVRGIILLLALIFITSESKRTVPLGLNYLITGDVFLWGPIMAGAVLSSLPVIILYFAAQRFMVQGLTGGATKG